MRSRQKPNPSRSNQPLEQGDNVKLIPRAQLGSAWLFAGALVCVGGCGHTTKVKDTPAEDRKPEREDADDKRTGSDERRRAKPASSPSAQPTDRNIDQVPV